MGERSRAPSLEPVAGAVQRLAVLLAAGVAPASSWRYLAENTRGPTSVLVTEVAQAASAGAPVGEAIVAALAKAPPRDRAAWRGVAAAWVVATEAGAPLAPTLLGAAGSLRALAQIQRELAVALAGPVATARMVMALPLVGVLFGLALGFDTIGTLVTTTPGLTCLVAGASLMLAGRLWNARLVRSAQPRDLTPGLTLDLMAIAVTGGTSLSRARAVVDAALAAAGLQAETTSDALDDVLGLSSSAGVPAAALLRSEADEERRRAKDEGDRRAATLAVTLMIPLGVCVLPAFMLLGVAPMLISVISSTITTL